jgi:folylpolyglutamate synthase/dihydropteroate synthase
VAEAIDLARTAAGPTGAVLVTGSLFTVGDAKRALA